MVRLFWLLLLLAGGVFGLIRHVQTRPILHPPGVLAPHAPFQAQLTPQSDLRLEKPGFRFEPVAYIEIEARVLSKRLYRYDAASSISPVDLALGWGRMSDSAIIRKLRIWQADRFYFYAWGQNPPIPPSEVAMSSANMHLIPGNPNIDLRLRRLKPGHLVQIKGFLVNVTGPNGFLWRTSTLRTDTGNGACEIVWAVDLVVR